MRHINRVEPAGPAQAYDTYRITAPIQTHRQPATCAEVGCKHHREGWMTRCDETTTDGRILPDGSELGGSVAASYVRSMSDRRFVEWRNEDGLTVFSFEPGQTCFAADNHTVPLEREPFYTRSRGITHKGLHSSRRYDRGDQWVDDFQTNQDNLSKLRGE